MKKKLVVALLSVGVLVGGCAYFITYSITQYNLENEIKSVTEEQLEEIETYDVEELKIAKEGEYDFKTMEEFGELTAGDIVNCSAVLSNGANVVVSGYVVNGDEDKVEYINSKIKITVKE